MGEKCQVFFSLPFLSLSLLSLHLGMLPTQRSYPNWDYCQLEPEKFKMNSLLTPKGEESCKNNDVSSSPYSLLICIGVLCPNQVVIFSPPDALSYSCLTLYWFFVLKRYVYRWLLSKAKTGSNMGFRWYGVCSHMRMGCMAQKVLSNLDHLLQAHTQMR